MLLRRQRKPQPASPLGDLPHCWWGKLIGAIETTDECETIEKVAMEFKQEPAKLIGVQRPIAIARRTHVD